MTSRSGVRPIRGLGDRLQGGLPLSSLAIVCVGATGLSLVRDVADERVLAAVVEYEGTQKPTGLWRWVWRSSRVTWAGDYSAASALLTKLPLVDHPWTSHGGCRAGVEAALLIPYRRFVF